MNTKVRTAVVLLQLGGPDNLDAVQPFLYNHFSDKESLSSPWPFRHFTAKKLARKAAPELLPVYDRFGGGTPLIPQAEAQAKTLERRLRSLGFDCPVRIAMKAWHPFISDVVQDLVEQGVTRIVALPLYPHKSQGVSTSHIEAVRKSLSKLKPQVELLAVDGFSVHPRYVECMAEFLQRTLSMDAEDAPQPLHVLFTAQSITERQSKRAGESYLDDVKASASAIASRVATNPAWSLCFQKGLGPGAWVGPFADDRIRELAQAGVRSLVVVPIAFVSEQVETLYELDEKYYEVAVEAGIDRYMRVATPQTNPIFIDALADLVQEAVVAGRDTHAT